MRKRGFKSLYQAILALQTENEARAFLRDLLTAAEFKEFENRWEAAQMLSQKIPYLAIEKSTGLSSTTVARVSKWLNQGKGGYRSIIGRLNNTAHNHKQPARSA